ncbi:uncharacterized protein Z519_05806 [Cladophialophora bantiana CBS 173.52]|uniref:Transcription factor domain-containing protein n=1 Tax=Cladophialophora bantiana (strain ATCC 10958 / CBS 173.52 / CDC B-1940 / NIH 8579) TaxID=1442370 RepID=A0A0D2ETF0_CLAB1|nr:uncharacterized protein Z519_05806 [Cladophialophora bantiana CBS 173.52]KIW93201.1 hypothetical protein Z519_05806 [Cladophialophora bantiana CBS 173.52]
MPRSSSALRSLQSKSNLLRVPSESTGEPRLLENPYQRVEDIKCAVTYLSLLPEVDESNIGALGIYGSGGYVPFAAQTDTRIRAAATVSGVCVRRLTRGGILKPVDPSALQTGLDMAGKLRIEEMQGAKGQIMPILLDNPEDVPDLQDFMWKDTARYYKSEHDSLRFSQEAIALAKEPKELYATPGKTHAELDDEVEDNMLVVNFLHSVTNYYYAIYPPQFLEEYFRWWTGRASNQNPSLEFTCLLFERCHHTAERLSHTLGPGVGGLIQVQQLFLTACWFKSEARFVESWHSLSSAIREAPELGMHNDSISRGLTEFDLEMRRRVCCSFELPNCRLEESNSQRGLVSPFTHVKLYCQIARELSGKFGKVNGDPGQILEEQKEIEAWMNSFPPVPGITIPDTSWGMAFPHLALQRHQLHALAFMTLSGPLKPYLTKSLPRTEVPNTEAKLPAIGVDCCLKLLDSAQRLFDLLFPTGAKNFLLRRKHLPTSSTRQNLRSNQVCSRKVETAQLCIKCLYFITRHPSSYTTANDSVSNHSEVRIEHGNVIRRRRNLDRFHDLKSVETGSVGYSSQRSQSRDGLSSSGRGSLPGLLSVELGQLGEIGNWDMLNLDPD